MTAEMVIMNRGGVALAADSAVTIGTGAGSKIYNSVNKIFTVSRTQPIGIMIYGNAEYMGVPWETVIKLYREQLGKKSFPSVTAYATDFLKFVNNEIPVDASDEAMRVALIWSSYFDDIQRHVRRNLVRRAQTQTLTNTDAEAIFLSAMKAYVKELKNRETLGQYRRLRPDQIYRRFKPQFEAVKKNSFQGRRFTPEIDRALQEFAGLVLVKAEFHHCHSGLVFAGFGTREIFPSLYNVGCVGRVLGKMKLAPNEQHSITTSPSKRVHVEAFAQREMVYRYMEGIDPQYANYLRDAINTLVSRLTDDLVGLHSPNNKAQAKKKDKAKRAALLMVADLEKKAELFRYSQYVSPLLDVVSVLPKEELAELAGALVNITSTKRKFAMEAETVGGPVDVAVISKGDGFIWIRRKHYFKPELNHGFLNHGLLKNLMMHNGE